MSVVPAAVEPALTAERGRRAAGRARWLIMACYLAAALILTWRLWEHPSTSAQVGDPEDVDLVAWFMRYAATAVSHGHLPALVTTAMNAPRGINMMVNTSFLLPSIVLIPVTLLAGPQVSLTIVLTLGYAGSAATLFSVLNRWGAGLAAAALGGAIYGFSAAMIDSGVGHYNIEFAVLPPLIIHMVLRVVTGRNGAGEAEREGIPWRAGIWMGLLTAAQVFTGEELLAQTALAAVVIVAVLAASFPHAARVRARAAMFGLAIGVAVAVLICARALWVQLRGPLAVHGSWEVLGTFTSHLGAFVNPPGSLLIHTRSPVTATANGSNFITEYLAYLGWPLLVVLVTAGVYFWRDLKVRVAAVTWAVLEVLSLGGQSRTFLAVRFPGALLPWHWLQGLPVIGEVLPDRLAVLADGAAAAVLAFSLQRAWSAGTRSWGWRGRSLVAGIAAVALIPLIPLPIQASTVPPVPAGWQAAFARLRLAPAAPVLVVPVPYSHQPEVLRWQADTGQPGSFAGGWFVGPNQTGYATVEYFGPVQVTAFYLYLDALWRGSPPPIAPSAAQLKADLGYLRPAAVVAVTTRASPLARYLTRVFGEPSFGVGGVLVWRR
jgi:hypothetical protein